MTNVTITHPINLLNHVKKLDQSTRFKTQIMIKTNLDTTIEYLGLKLFLFH
jgi:hypothetical protein